MPRKNRLLDNLIDTLPRHNFKAVVDFETHLFAEMQGILRVLPGDCDRAPVDESVQRQRGTLRLDFLDELLHLLPKERHMIQAVHILVILVQDIRPVLQQILLGRTVEKGSVFPTVILVAPVILPALTLECSNQRPLKIRLPGKYFHEKTS